MPAPRPAPKVQRRHQATPAKPTAKPATRSEAVHAAKAQTDRGHDFSHVPAQTAGTPSSALPGQPPSLKLDPQFLPPVTHQSGLDMRGGRTPNLGVEGTAPLTLSPHLFQMPATTVTNLIDWSAMTAPFAQRGMRLDPADQRSIEQYWTYSYRMLLGLGLSPDLAISVSNLGLPIAYDHELARDHPTTEERLDLQIDKMLPPGQKPPTRIVVPLLTPATLHWMTKEITGKDIDFHF